MESECLAFDLSYVYELTLSQHLRSEHPKHDAGPQPQNDRPAWDPEPSLDLAANDNWMTGPEGKRAASASNPGDGWHDPTPTDWDRDPTPAGASKTPMCEAAPVSKDDTKSTSDKHLPKTDEGISALLLPSGGSVSPTTGQHESQPKAEVELSRETLVDVDDDAATASFGAEQTIVSTSHSSETMQEHSQSTQGADFIEHTTMWAQRDNDDPPSPSDSMVHEIARAFAPTSTNPQKGPYSTATPIAGEVKNQPDDKARIETHDEGRGTTLLPPSLSASDAGSIRSNHCKVGSPRRGRNASKPVSELSNHQEESAPVQSQEKPKCSDEDLIYFSSDPSLQAEPDRHGSEHDIYQAPKRGKAEPRMPSMPRQAELAPHAATNHIRLDSSKTAVASSSKEQPQTPSLQPIDFTAGPRQGGASHQGNTLPWITDAHAPHASQSSLTGSNDHPHDQPRSHEQANGRSRRVPLIDRISRPHQGYIRRFHAPSPPKGTDQAQLNGMPNNHESSNHRPARNPYEDLGKFPISKLAKELRQLREDMEQGFVLVRSDMDAQKGIQIQDAFEWGRRRAIHEVMEAYWRMGPREFQQKYAEA